jgi:hypothetical protein
MDHRDQPGIYKFTFVSSNNYVVKLANISYTHSPEVVSWLHDKFGPEDLKYWPKVAMKSGDVPWHIWKRGTVVHYTIQEFYFTNAGDAMETWLTFS